MTYSVRGFCRISARPALVALSLALLAGCANRQHVTVGALPDDYRTNHPITIAEREQVTDIPVAQADQKLSPMQRGIVQGAIANYRRGGSGMLYVLVPSGTSNQAAAYRLSTEVSAMLRRGGIKANNIAIENYPVENPEAAAPIRISYYAMTAVPRRTILPLRSPIRPIFWDHASCRQSIRTARPNVSTAIRAT